VPQHRGPWYCWICLKRLVKEGVVDVTLDFDLLDFLSHGHKPDYYETLRRVMEASNYLHIDDRGVLWVSGEASGPPR
jgi:hypothetical protein